MNVCEPTPSTAGVDATRKPLALLVWWVIPIIIGNTVDHLSLPAGSTAWVWTAALAWMGLGCLRNARACGRRHCYLSGPILLVGAVIVGLLAAGVLSLGPGGLNLTLWTTFGLVVLSFLPELIWGKYATPSRK